MNEENKSIEEEEQELDAQLKKQAADKRNAEQLKKKNQPKPKVYYDLKIESMIPATLHFRILAETPEQAVELLKNHQPVGVKHKLAGRKDSKITVYDSGSSIVRFFKRLF